MDRRDTALRATPRGNSPESATLHDRWRKRASADAALAQTKALLAEVDATSPSDARNVAQPSPEPVQKPDHRWADETHKYTATPRADSPEAATLHDRWREHASADASPETGASTSATAERKSTEQATETSVAPPAKKAETAAQPVERRVKAHSSGGGALKYWWPALGGDPPHGWNASTYAYTVPEPTAPSTDAVAPSTAAAPVAADATPA